MLSARSSQPIDDESGAHNDHARRGDKEAQQRSSEEDHAGESTRGSDSLLNLEAMHRPSYGPA